MCHLVILKLGRVQSAIIQLLRSNEALLHILDFLVNCYTDDTDITMTPAYRTRRSGNAVANHHAVVCRALKVECNSTFARGIAACVRYKSYKDTSIWCHKLCRLFDFTMRPCYLVWYLGKRISYYNQNLKAKHKR